MAESAVTFLLEQLAILIKEERQLLGGLHEKVKEIERQLKLMQAFLRVADAKEDSDPELKEWVSQVRELAYDAEDVLDMFMLRFGHLSTDGFIGCFKKVYSTMKNYSARRNVASQLREIDSKIKKMEEGHLRFQSKYEASMHASSSHVVDRKFDGRDDARLVDAKVLVGIERPKEKLISQILDGNNSHLKAISVVGMGGVGKSTLVNSIYEDEQVKKKFNCHAWVTISQVYDIKELLKKLIRDLYDDLKEPLPENVKSLDDVVQLKKFVQNFLRQKIYVIILDDIWNVYSWDDIRHALPNSNTGSRVLLTTRIHDVANATRVEYCGYVYEMKGLHSQESWTLFCNKTFQDKICPQHLEGIAKRILVKCDGLPLAILTIGGMLASKENAISEWEMISKSLESELDGELEKVKHVVLLSYYDLPFYLRSCLLYCSIFPEDWSIGHGIIVELWAAEGLVQGTKNRTKEEVAAGYLNKLIHRNLVQETKAGQYYLHDIVREVIVSKSREQNLLSTGSDQKDSMFPTKVRRLSFHSSIDDAPKTDSLKHLRSIVLFSPKDSETKQVINDLVAGNHKLLKVLFLQGAPLKEIPNEVSKLYLLKYLNLSKTEVKVIPKSIGKLLHLETLDLGSTNVIELPVQTLKLKRLRHLLVYKYILREDHLQDTFYVQSFHVTYKIGSLSSLQSLKYIDADQMGDTSMVKEIGRLTQLKKLGICKLRREDGKDLCSSIGELSDLSWLDIKSAEANNEIIDLDYSLSSIPQFLQWLCLEGRLEKVPQWVPFLLELKCLYLESSKLRDDPLEFLEDLPNLEKLCLTDAYEGTKLHFKAKKFPSLIRLKIQHMEGLKSIVLGDDSMPRLTELDIKYCKQMMELPVGLLHLTKLQEFKVKCMNEKFVKAIENGIRSDEIPTHIAMATYVWRG